MINENTNRTGSLGQHTVRCVSYLQHTVATVLLLAQQLECVGVIAGRDDAVRYFTRDNFGRDQIAGIGQCDEVAER